jgi:mRNA-degrading endonuclease RelE of RelBE toxin-antitoxin system
MRNTAWTIVVHPNFIKALYQIGRGLAGDISDVLELIASDPTRFGVPIPDKPGFYRCKLIDHVLIYEVDQNLKFVRMFSLLAIEKKEGEAKK